MDKTTWSGRIREIESLGWSLTRIAKAIGLSVQALSDIKAERTTEPRGMPAVRLYQLHARKTRKRAA